MAKATFDKPLPRTSVENLLDCGAKRETPSLLLSIKSLARELDVCERTIRKLNSGGKLPKPLTVGGSVRWRTEEIQEWISAGCPARRDGQP